MVIPYGRQEISEADIQAVVDVLHSDFLTQGPVVPAFENSVASYSNAKYAIAVNSATSALHIACLALGVGEGDMVWTSPISFVASANCALYCGAKVDFVDIDPQTYNLSIEKLAEKLELAEKSGCLPKAVIPVHLSGQSCEMQAIYELALKYNFKIIEDASHAIGGKYLDDSVGNCKFSDITVFSFHPVKIITTGEGGMALTNQPELAQRMRLFRSHGITRDEGQMTHPSEGPWYYQQIELGFNYRMTDIQAALGLNQMQRLDEFVAKRHEIAKFYDKELSQLPLITPLQHSDTYSAFHLYVVRLKLKEINQPHKEVFLALREAGIGVNLHYIPIYKHPYYDQLGYQTNQYPEAEQYYAEAISLPMFTGLTQIQQSYVIDTLRQVLIN